MQLTVYNYNGGPCYRCLFPTPPPSTACQRCSDSGVLGVVTVDFDHCRPISSGLLADGGRKKKREKKKRSSLSQGREKEEEGEEEENLDFFLRRVIRRSVSPRRVIRRLRAISSPHAGRRNVSPRGVNERGDVKIRGRSPLCPICGENAAFTRENFQSFDYENFTQSPMSDRVSLPPCVIFIVISDLVCTL
ncbi:hypothetical protein GW17_00024575 [Ensete ventricosum]|nr:hypothetical protein GW17_00024575 [Ensete ventricosum]